MAALGGFLKDMSGNICAFSSDVTSGLSVTLLGPVTGVVPYSKEMYLGILFEGWLLLDP